MLQFGLEISRWVKKKQTHIHRSHTTSERMKNERMKTASRMKNPDARAVHTSDANFSYFG